MIGIIDYGVGNIKAFAHCFKLLNISYKIISSKNDLELVSKILLPGVGSYDFAIESLNKSGMRDTLDELVLEKKIPILGICVGLQMFSNNSEEGKLKGLNWIKSSVKQLQQSTTSSPIPHMGWNTLNLKKENPLTKNLTNSSRLYYLHSYIMECENEEDVIASTNYNQDFASIINKENIYGIQGHPEKSHQTGLTLLKNFAELQCFTQE